MNNWYWYMGWKQTRYYRKQTAICVGGIAATVVVLMVILSFGQGIEEFLTARILLLTPHLTLEAGANDFITTDWQQILLHTPGITGSSPYMLFPGLIQRGLVSETVIFKGIDWDLENGLFNLEKLLEKGQWAQIRGGAGLLLGVELAQQLGVDVGTPVTVVTTNGGQIIPVSGLFYTGYYPLDGGLVLLPLDVSQKILQVEGVSGYGVKVANFPQVDQYILPLQELTDLWVRPWYAREQSMFIAMSVQRIVLIWIMIFSMLVSALGIMNIFLLRSWEQRRNVGVFRTLGATPKQIGALFLVQGLYCGVLGGLLGILLARITVMLLGLVDIHLPQVFYLERLPISWSSSDLWWVLLLALGTGLVAVLWPAWRMTKVEPGEVVRHA